MNGNGLVEIVIQSGVDFRQEEERKCAVAAQCWAQKEEIAGREPGRTIEQTRWSRDAFLEDIKKMRDQDATRL